MDELKELKTSKEKEMLQLLLLRWLCNANPWAGKHMNVLINLFGREFTTLDMPFKQSRAYELVKDWESKGLIKVTDYTSKARKYTLTTTLFAKSIEQQDLAKETKQALLERLDEILSINHLL